MGNYKGLTPARTEANKRYDAKTYKKYTLALRIEDDADIIQSMQEAQDQGLNKREWLRELFDLVNK